jgi:hypothetical protein
MEETTSVAGADNTDAQAAAAKRFAEASTELMSSMEDCLALGVDIVAELVERFEMERMYAEINSTLGKHAAFDDYLKERGEFNGGDN